MNIGMGRAFEISGEMWVIDYISKRFDQMKTPIVVFDAGANSGEHAKYILDTYGKKFIVYSFEPLPGAYKKLVQNVGEYGNAKNFNIAVGEKNETMPIYAPTPQSVLASLHQIDFL